MRHPSSYVRENETYVPRRVLLKLHRGQREGDTWAVVDARSGAYYGLVQNEQVWGARDWEGLSLNVPISTYVLPDTTPEAWANRLVDRADRKGGLPVPDDPEEALGIVGDFLFLPGGKKRRFNVYTPGGTYLGTVEGSAEPHAQGLWVATPPSLPEGVQYDVVEAFTRDSAARQLPRDDSGS